MKFSTITILFAVGVSAHGVDKRHAHIHKRQATTTSVASSSTASSTAVASASAASSAASSAVSSVTSAAASSATSSAAVVSISGPSESNAIPLASLTFGMSAGTTWAPTTTYAASATALVSGAPAVPSFVFSNSTGQWPTMDKLPPTDSDEVTEWMKELDGFDIPDLEPTTDGTCASDPTFAANASSRGWWTCGEHTRDTDITACPTKYTWGVSFDDGPGPYSGKLLQYLEEKDINATFFVVGSRVIEYPALLVEEYMAGHEISVHTWSHPYLTTLTNIELVAEFGWTRKAIQSVLGVTPTTMRPPYGDIDDRVRAVALAMGLIPIIWTTTPSGVSFDTFDWKIAGDVVTAEQSYVQFQNILGNASEIDTGFIVLQHDLFEVTVDMAIGYTLDSALTHNPPFALQPIGLCSNIPTANLYRETNTNTSFPYPNSTADVTSGNATSSATGSSDNGASASGFPVMSTLALLVLAVFSTAF